LISNGETELFHRVLATGGRIVYWPAATVEHRVPRERLTQEWFRERALAQGASDVLTEATGPRTDAVIRCLLLARETVRMIGDLPDLLRHLARERRRFDFALWLAYARGRRAEIRRLRVGP
jgi:hypothetical protein